ncbi:hypothetical protein KAF44_25255, partial (plasmid) [Cupriavidus necator]
MSTYFAGSVEVPGREAPLSTGKHCLLVSEESQAMQESQFRDTMRGRGCSSVCFARAKNEYLLPFIADHIRVG